MNHQFLGLLRRISALETRKAGVQVIAVRVAEDGTVLEYPPATGNPAALTVILKKVVAEVPHTGPVN